MWGPVAAGLTLALKLAQHADVVVLSKSTVNEGSTFYAQGGVAAVFDEQDSIDSHVEDTLIISNQGIILTDGDQENRLVRSKKKKKKNKL